MEFRSYIYDTLVEAKYENEVDFGKIEFESRTNNDMLYSIINNNKFLLDILNKFKEDKNVFCYIFANTITFRIGKSSILIGGKKAKASGTIEKAEINSNNAFNRIYSTMLLAYSFDSTRVLSQEDKTENAENAQLADLQKIFRDRKNDDRQDFIRIKLGSEVYIVDDIFQTKGRPKSDIYFSYQGKPIIHVSLKKGLKAADFQQYGGLSNDLGFKDRKSSVVSGSGYKEIIDFLEDVDRVLKAHKAKKIDGKYDVSSLPKGNNYARILKDTEVANICMFGKDFGRELGINNVHILLDGDISLTVNKDGTYSLKGTYHSHINPQIPGGKNADKKGIYAPVLFVMRSEKQKLKQGGFINARVVIWPNNKIAQKYAKDFEEKLKHI